jgi:hypothetical protein
MTQPLAPNGKPSNLTPKQWKLVRTPQFKAWFGFWEENSLIDNKKQGITDLITQNYKRAIQRSITAGININECELNTSFIDSVLRITVLKKNNNNQKQRSEAARKEIKLFFA